MRVKICNQMSELGGSGDCMVVLHKGVSNLGVMDHNAVLDTIDSNLPDGSVQSAHFD